MHKMMSRLCSLLLYFVAMTYNIDFLAGYEEIVFLSRECEYEIYSPNEDKTFKVLWRGADPGRYGCSVSFVGRNPDDVSDEYKVCIETVRFNLQEQGIQVNFHLDSITNTPAKIYTMGDNPSRSKFCGNDDKLVGISVTKDDFRDVDTSKSSFSFKITAIKTYNNVNVAAVVGGCIGGLALLVCLCACCCWSSNRNKSDNTGSTPVTEPATVPTQVGLSGGTSQPANYPHRYGEYSQLPQQLPPPSGQSGDVPLVSYPYRGYPPPQYPPSAQVHQNFHYPVGNEQLERLEPSAPPPSYEDVTKPREKFD